MFNTPSNTYFDTMKTYMNDMDLTVMDSSDTPGILFTPLGLKVVEGTDVTSELYSRLFAKVKSLYKASSWLLGDTLALADRTWGNQHTGSKYEEAAQLTGLSIGTIKGIVRTCLSFPLEQRSMELSFTHHLEIWHTSLPEPEKERVIQEARAQNMSCTALRKRLREVKAASMTTEEKRELNGENDDRPFGLVEMPEPRKENEPPMFDLLKLKMWIRKHSVDEVPAAQRVELLNDFTVILPFVAELYAVAREAGDEGVPDLAFDADFGVRGAVTRSPAGFQS